MSKKSFSSTFGAPKPLPGQLGYGISQTQQLETEAKEMEFRLLALKEKMSRDAKEDNDKTKLDGNRWSSARPDKGSVTSYAKDVQQRIFKKKTEPVLTATAEGRRAVRNAKVTGDYKSKEVNNWNVQDVAQWLTSMMLDQYTQVFISNQIDGPILLDISLDDLDYMEIKVLGHRKIILRGIEDLRNNKKVTIPLFASNTPTNENTVPIQHDIQLRSKDDNVSKSLSAINDNDNKKLIHWSHLEPLSTNDNPEKDSSNINVNPADGDYNEAAEQAAFMEAVLEWRQGSKKGNTKIEREFETEKQNDGMWHNPFAAPSTSLIDDSDLDSPTTHSDAKGNNFNKNKGASSLLTGELDEEAEREEFKKAVEAWRQNKPSGTVTVTNMVDELSKQLDEEQKSSALRIQMQKQEMQRRLDEANMEYAQMKKEQALKNDPEQISNEIDINDSDDEYDYDYNHSEDSKSESKYSPIPHSNTYSSKYTPDNSSKELTLENFTPENDNSAKFSYIPEVEVKLVESYEYKGEDIGNDCYVVEENSDDDS